MMGDLTSLRKRLETSPMPNREVDALIYTEIVGLEMYESIYLKSDGDLCVRDYPGPPGPSYRHLPRYTASVDAALRLPEGEKADSIFSPQTLLQRAMDNFHYSVAASSHRTEFIRQLPRFILLAYLGALDGR
jgi:hypothetical protein